MEVVGENKDFWEQIQDPNCPQHFILSNPPFSYKWQIIQTLIEKKRDFALILPWEVFMTNTNTQMARRQKPSNTNVR